MEQAKWIWYPGDFELYHSMLLHARREDQGREFPAFWRIKRPEYGCVFSKKVRLANEVRLKIVTYGKGLVRVDGGCPGLVNQELVIPAGEHTVSVDISSLEAFPSIFIDSPALKTDETWFVHCFDKMEKPAACEPAYLFAEDDPTVFPFSYRELVPVSIEKLDGGTLYDFGEECFGSVTVMRTADMGDITLIYGESREEALDYDNAIIREVLWGAHADAGLKRPPRAFRYLYVKAQAGDPAVNAKLEYLPIEDIASFTCDDDVMPAIWDMCVRTIHLNSREFYMDGIKRDRWVWSGDAYQSFIVNRYLYAEPGIVRRTIRAMLGKPPYTQHINTINDYSFYVFLALWEHYYATADRDFVASVWDDLKALYDFITSRLDRDSGYVVYRPGDWIFIDWADIDKSGPVCGEQILLWQTYTVMSHLARLVEEDGSMYKESAEKLKSRIMRDFWDEERGGFLDCCGSEKRHITRHANIFAILYDFVDEDRAKRIHKSILCSDAAEPITTPYFKFFELMVLAKMREMESVQDYIDSYWGGMAELGATTVWERFDPRESGIQHYGMYGQKFGRSLCHAWGSGPIALLGMYCAGVTPTSVGGETFLVKPDPGRYRSFSATVPIGSGKVQVSYKDGALEVLSDVSGGTLLWKGREYLLPAGRKMYLERIESSGIIGE